MNWGMNEDCACGERKEKGLGHLGAKCKQKSKSREFKSMFESSFFQSGSKFRHGKKTLVTVFETGEKVSV